MKTQNQAEASSGCNYIKKYLSLFVSICLYHSCAFSLTFAKDVLPTSHSFFPPPTFLPSHPGYYHLLSKQHSGWLTPRTISGEEEAIKGRTSALIKGE